MVAPGDNAGTSPQPRLSPSGDTSGAAALYQPTGKVHRLRAGLAHLLEEGGCRFTRCNGRLVSRAGQYADGWTDAPLDLDGWRRAPRCWRCWPRGRGT